MTVVVAVVVLVAAGGCQFVFGTGDGHSALEPCPNGGIDDHFDDPQVAPCAPWGSADLASSNVRLDDGQLLISPLPNAPMAEFGGCTGFGTSEFGTRGQILEVTGAIGGQETYIAMHAFRGQPSAIDATIVQERGTIVLREGDVDVSPPIAYVPSAMRWWRLRPQDDGRGVVAHYSADGVGWVLLGSITGTAPRTVRPNFGVGTYAPVAQPGTASFGRFQLCAP